MKRRNLKDKAIVLGILLVISICVGISYSTAYFRAKMTYDTEPQVTQVVMANVSASFDGGQTVSLEGALPGDSISKTFSITNDSTTTQIISINFSSITNDFVNEDIVYSLYELDGDSKTLLVENVALPTTTSQETTMLDCDEIDANTTKTYELVLLFKETDTDQSVNMGKVATANISVSALDGSSCDNENKTSNEPYTSNIVSYLSSTKITELDDVVIDETDDKNIRYVGLSPKNYVWFNCFDYSDTSTCERWRIIGLMNNVDTPNGKQNLAKIIRADDIKNADDNRFIFWDYSSDKKTSNVWDGGEGRSTIKSILNDAYYGTKTVTTADNSNNDNTRSYQFTKDENNTELPRGITTPTLSMVAKATWNVTAMDPNNSALTFYNTKDTTWSGYVGLMDPSDYGLAISGIDDYDRNYRSTCINYSLYSLNMYDPCSTTTWLRYFAPTDEKPNGSLTTMLWTMRPYSGYDNELYEALRVSNGGTINCGNVDNDFLALPVLYLTSDVNLTISSESNGSYENPYQLSVQ